MKTMESFAEGLVRYKRWYPEICKGRSDIEILLYRNLITPEQAKQLAKMAKEPKSNAGGAGKDLKNKENNPKPVRPYTVKQVEKIGRDAAKDWIADNPDTDLDQVAYDLAESLLFDDDRLVAYFYKQEITEKINMAEAMAEYVVG
jgi:hypothetical protein